MAIFDTSFSFYNTNVHNENSGHSHRMKYYCIRSHHFVAFRSVNVYVCVPRSGPTIKEPRVRLNCLIYKTENAQLCQRVFVLHGHFITVFFWVSISGKVIRIDNIGKITWCGLSHHKNGHNVTHQYADVAFARIHVRVKYTRKNKHSSYVFGM